MKKLLILIAVATILGGISGKLLFSKYENIDKLVFNENKKVYLLQEGVYSSKSSLDSNTKDISPTINAVDIIIRNKTFNELLTCTNIFFILLKIINTPNLFF